MKIAIIIGALLLVTGNSIGQSGPLPQDSSIRFNVHGACIQCKERIEKALRIKGVSSASWSIESKILSLVYRPSVISLETIRKRIVRVGHDLDDLKAPDAVYNALPACCHYRLQPEQPSPVKNDTSANIIPSLVKGIVLETDKRGQFIPLAGASVIWLGTTSGVITDSSGVFQIRNSNNNNLLVVSYAGYRPDTLAIGASRELRIILASNKQLKEVTVTSKMRSTYLSGINPIRTQVMTEKELFKAACCNLSESFETNPSVDVSYSDAVTGAKQIQLLGLSGIYTQLTVENLPGPRGLATAMGLNSIAGPWVESIQLTKGIGSVANGFESIAGQINVELKKPEAGEKLFANAYINSMGKTDLNLNLSTPVGKKWHTGLLIHEDFLFNKTLDGNKDDFRDLPSGNQFSAINRWKYDNGNGWMVQAGIKLLIDERTGGELGFEPSRDKYTTYKYGIGFTINRYVGFAKIGYVFPQKKYKSLGLQLSGSDHSQSSYFGLTQYDAKQRNLYANLIYQSIIGSTMHKFRTGLSFVYDRYNESLRKSVYKRTESVPGAFFEYTYTPSTRVTVVAGIRGDKNNLFGFFITPRLHLRYEPFNGTTIRLSIGRGQRTANIFAENTGYLVSSRQVSILHARPGKAYGLDPEVAWNKGISIDQKFKLRKRDAMLSIDFFRNDFIKQVVVDIEDPAMLKFYNLAGRSYSNSFQVEVSGEPIKNLDVRLAYRYFDVRVTYSGTLMQRPLVASHRAFANLGYGYKGWKFDYTVNYIGKKRIPSTSANPPVYQRGLISPAYALMNAQISKTLGKKHPVDVYLGSENLGGFIQRDAVIAADQPFGPYFDASMIWGPVSGRLIYLGVRLKIK